ncbi:MAG: tetratricopeptide repeat protein [Pseudomonadota bacterium]
MGLQEALKYRDDDKWAKHRLQAEVLLPDLVRSEKRDSFMKFLPISVLYAGLGLICFVFIWFYVDKFDIQQLIKTASFNTQIHLKTIKQVVSVNDPNIESKWKDMPIFSPRVFSISPPTSDPAAIESKVWAQLIQDFHRNTLISTIPTSEKETVVPVNQSVDPLLFNAQNINPDSSSMTDTTVSNKNESAPLQSMVTLETVKPKPSSSRIDITEQMQLMTQIRALIRGGDINAGLTIFKDAFSQTDIHLETLMRLVDALREENQYEKSIQYLIRYQKRFSRDIEYWVELGQTYKEMKNLDEAIAAYRQVISLDSSAGLMQAALASLYDQKNDLIQANQFYRSALRRQDLTQTQRSLIQRRLSQLKD